jgi:hypothetical protein
MGKPRQNAKPTRARRLRRNPLATERHCPRDLAGLRDRALLLLAARGLSRSALVGLDAEHLRFTATTVELAVGAGHDPGGGQQTCVVRRGTSLAVCPVQALRDWLESSATRFGPSTAGAASSIIVSAPMRSVGSWPTVPCAVLAGPVRKPPHEPRRQIPAGCRPGGHRGG